MGNDTKILDSIMGCSICGYYTCNIRNFARHQISKKHLLKMDEELQPDADLAPAPAPAPAPDPDTKTGPDPEPEIVVEKKHTPRRRTKTRTNAGALMNEIRNNRTCFQDEHEHEHEDREFEYYLNPMGFIHEWSHIFMLLVTFLCHIYNYSMDCLFESESYMNTA